MFNRDWLRYFARGVIAAAVLFGLIQIGTAVWLQYELRRYTYQDYKRRAYSTQDETASKIADICSVKGLTLPFLRNCLEEQIKAYAKEDTSDKDLEAQQDMAFWALWAVVVGFGSLIVGGVGLVGLFKSLSHTKRAISNDREIGEAQVRAYLTVENQPQSSGPLAPGKIITTTLRVINTGQSPAYDVRHIAALMPLPFPLAENQGDLIAPDPESVRRGTPIRAGGDIRIDAELTRPLTPEEVKSVLTEGDIRLFAVVIVYYLDVFKREVRRTKYCAFLTPGKEPVIDLNGRRIGTRYEWELASVHNEAT